jgi:hypothetical protein
MDVELFSLTKAPFRVARGASKSFPEQLLEVFLQRRP